MEYWNIHTIDPAKELDEYMSKLGMTSEFHLIQEALRLFIAEHRWRFSGNVVGAISVICNHDVGDADEELTNIQHEFLDIIVEAFHLYLGHENYLLMILVKGEVGV